MVWAIIKLYSVWAFSGLLTDWGAFWGGGLPKISHTYPTMMKLGTVTPYLKKIQKLNKSRDTPLYSADISTFLPEISKFCYIKKYRYRFHLDTYFLTLLTFLEPLRIVLMNMVRILMMSTKMAHPGLLKIKIF